jgi:transcriptional regulator with XRE-family HTH domain
MAIGERLKEAREAAGITQLEMTFDIPASRSAIGMWEIEKRPVPKDMMPHVTKVLDCGFLAMEFAAEVTGRAWVTKLDGSRVELTRGNVTLKSHQEMVEALNANSRIGELIVDRPESLDQRGRDELEDKILQLIDVIVALSHQVAVLCRDYGFSWWKLWQKHRKKLKERGYVKA